VDKVFGRRSITGSDAAESPVAEVTCVRSLLSSDLSVAESPLSNVSGNVDEDVDTRSVKCPASVDTPANVAVVVVSKVGDKK